ncbi:glutathione S-transferase family protein (plasmid) [Tabrizicola piscis]|uniref:Glutathione S-transferase family protein n=1 Tax=Tabrizicola piscis TaxID=2494374 RepID=A0A3S8UCX7_9RHOB|nr:glutathione S-transferase [Tabrizicola piscis]AZL61456.1 glutathione S-transferase family protein [Tabrizicola piscis]
MPAIRLHRFRLSGHSHRVELMLSLLGCPAEIIDLPSGAQKSPAFLAMNPFGQVPVIEDDGFVLADSNAILVYLATRYDLARQWYPVDAKAAAQVQRWLSVAAGPLFQGPAVARLVGLFDAKYDLPRAQAVAAGVLWVMEAHLAAGGPFFAGGAPTIADVALYSYTAHSPEGHISLDTYPEIRAWLHRVEALPGFVPMVRSVPKFGGPAA